MSIWLILLGSIATIIFVIGLSIFLRKFIFKKICKYSNELKNKKNEEDMDTDSILEIYDYLDFYESNEWSDEN